LTITAQSHVEPTSDARLVAEHSAVKAAMQNPCPRLISPRGLARFAAVIAALGLVGYAATLGFARHNDRAAIESELTGLGRGSYQAQKVVYHVDYDAGWRSRNYYALVGVLENHVKAVGADKLELKVILQGGGADLLALAKSEPAIAQRIDALKEKGVRFLVCKNTLLDRRLDPFADLYGVKREDIVTAAVAELVALQQEGYVYLHL
jgi:intracellular sulfur oxidation DsrE/DsrF family protein